MVVAEAGTVAAADTVAADTSQALADMAAGLAGTAADPSVRRILAGRASAARILRLIQSEAAVSPARGISAGRAWDERALQVVLSEAVVPACRTRHGPSVRQRLGPRARGCRGTRGRSRSPSVRQPRHRQRRAAIAIRTGALPRGVLWFSLALVAWRRGPRLVRTAVLALRVLRPVRLHLLAVCL